MQQLDQESRWIVSIDIYMATEQHTFVLLDDPANLLEACLKFATNSVCHIVHVGKQFALLFQLAAHVVGLLSQVAHGAEDTVESLVLFMHHLHLSLLFEGGIVVVLLKRIGIRQHVAVGSALALVLGVLDRLLQLLAHVLDLVADILHQRPSSLDFVYLQAEAVWVMLDGLDAFHQVLEILAEVLESLFELAAGFSELGAGYRGRRGAYAEI